MGCSSNSGGPFALPQAQGLIAWGPPVAQYRPVVGRPGWMLLATVSRSGSEADASWGPPGGCARPVVPRHLWSRPADPQANRTRRLPTDTPAAIYTPVCRVLYGCSQLPPSYSERAIIQGRANSQVHQNNPPVGPVQTPPWAFATVGHSGVIFFFYRHPGADPGLRVPATPGAGQRHHLTTTSSPGCSPGRRVLCVAVCVRVGTVHSSRKWRLSARPHRSPIGFSLPPIPESIPRCL